MPTPNDAPQPGASDKPSPAADRDARTHSSRCEGAISAAIASSPAVSIADDARFSAAAFASSGPRYGSDLAAEAERRAPATGGTLSTANVVRQTDAPSPRQIAAWLEVMRWIGGVTLVELAGRLARSSTASGLTCLIALEEIERGENPRAAEFVHVIARAFGVPIGGR